jgi:hypothetical protein
MRSARRSGASWVGVSVTALPMADWYTISHLIAIAGKTVTSIVLYIVGTKALGKGGMAISRAFSTLFLCPPEVSPMDGDTYHVTPFNSPQNNGSRRATPAGDPTAGSEVLERLQLIRRKLAVLQEDRE